MKNNIYEDSTYLNNNPTWHEQDSPWKAGLILKIINRNNLKPDSVCEVGCGAGEIIKILSTNIESGKTFDGYEVSPQAFKICSGKSSEKLSYYLKDILKEELSTYDIAMAIDIFEHVEDYLGFLKQLKSKAKYKIFHIPLDLSVQSILRGNKLDDLRRRIGHIHYFTKETALSSLRDAGYEIKDYFYTSSSLELPNRGWKANLMKIPRKLLFMINQDLASRLLGGFSLMVLAE
ncbi:MAG: class I SAM-dependent methyltransferase [Flavobacteriaceae bacterium]|nr:class I SAM-dependent methyltransferase [Flavobacteriaceae bacterium]